MKDQIFDAGRSVASRRQRDNLIYISAKIPSVRQNSLFLRQNTLKNAFHTLFQRPNSHKLQPRCRNKSTPTRFRALLGRTHRQHEKIKLRRHDSCSDIRDDHVVNENLGISRLHECHGVFQDFDTLAIWPVVHDLSEIVESRAVNGLRGQASK